MPTLDSLSEFESIFRQPALQRTWPQPSITADWLRSLGMADAAKVGHDLEDYAKAAKASSELIGRPIVGVLGQLNSGKSSVVARFLSPGGQSRLPRGLYDEHGTHRFVYWLPDSWQHDSSVWVAFRSILESAHGSKVEFLDDDPAKSSSQYRSGLGDPSVLGCPLVAFDSALNDRGFALLDCPDVQTRDQGSPQLDGKLNPRVEFVLSAAKTCSCFLYVWEASKLRESLFQDLLKGIRDSSPDVQIYLLVNKIRPAEGEPTRTRTMGAVQSALSYAHIPGTHVFGAFDYEIAARTEVEGKSQPGWSDLTPRELVELSGTRGASFPQFFSLSEDSEMNRPDAVDSSRFLDVALSSLPPAELQRNQFTGMIKNLRSRSAEAAAVVHELVEKRTQHARTVQNGLLEEVNSLFTDPDTKGPKQSVSPEYLAAFKKSLESTAPRPIRLALRMRRLKSEYVYSPIKRTASSVTQVLQAAIPWPNVAKLAGEIVSRSSGARSETTCWLFQSPEDIAKQLMGRKWFPSDVNAESVVKAINDALDPLGGWAYVPSRQELDRVAAEIWEQASTSNKMMIFTKSMLGTLGDFAAVVGGMAVVVDGGATYFGTIAMSQAISTPVGAVAVGVGGLIGLRTSIEDDLLRLNTLPMISRYFARLCDVFGVPRPTDFPALNVSFRRHNKRIKHSLVDPTIPSIPARCPLGDLSQWKVGRSVGQMREWGLSDV